VGQRAKQRHWQAVGAPVSIRCTNFHTDQLLLWLGAGVLQPGDRVSDCIIQAGVAVVELAMRFKTGVDQSVGPLHRHLLNIV